MGAMALWQSGTSENGVDHSPAFGLVFEGDVGIFDCEEVDFRMRRHSGRRFGKSQDQSKKKLIRRKDVSIDSGPHKKASRHGAGRSSIAMGGMRK